MKKIGMVLFWKILKEKSSGVLRKLLPEFLNANFNFHFTLLKSQNIDHQTKN